MKTEKEIVLAYKENLLCLLDWKDRFVAGSVPYIYDFNCCTCKYAFDG